MSATKKLTKDEAHEVMHKAVALLTEAKYVVKVDQYGRATCTLGKTSVTLECHNGRNHASYSEDRVVRVSMGWGRGERKVFRTHTAIFAHLMNHVAEQVRAGNDRDQTIMDSAARVFNVIWCAKRQGWKLYREGESERFSVKINCPVPDKAPREIKVNIQKYDAEKDRLFTWIDVGGGGRSLLTLEDAKVILTSGALVV